MAEDKIAEKATNHAVDIIKQLGPGLITGAADDDPSGPVRGLRPA